MPSDQQRSTNHTPGPWVAIPASTTWVVRSLSAFRSICSVHRRKGRAACAAEDDARLIEAAPEMLEALHVARLELKYLTDFWPTETGVSTLAMIEAVIAKATGTPKAQKLG